MNNLDMMRKRLEHQGGIRQDDRMIKDKYNTFQRALLFSYQACDVILENKYFNCHTLDPFEDDAAMEVNQPRRALINPDKTKQDYDDKILSIDYNSGFEPGDVFTWIGTNTKWLIYLQALTEDAYFRGEIRRCKYTINFKNEQDEEKYTWAAIRGPVETQIESIQKNQIRIDTPNLSLNILVPKNKDTLYAFERYKKFLFAGRCWRVEAFDTISITNVIEIAAEEYYINEVTDDIEKELVDGLVIKKVDPNEKVSKDEPFIQGETFIKPNIAETYISPHSGEWSIKDKAPACIDIISDTEVRVIWKKSTSGQFTLVWSDGIDTLEKIIVVESLF